MLATWVLTVVQLAARKIQQWNRGLVGITLEDTFHIPTDDYCEAVSVHRSAVSHAYEYQSRKGMSKEAITRESWNELTRVCALVLGEEHSLFRTKLRRLCESTGIAAPGSGRDDDAPVQYESPADTEPRLDRLAAWTEEFDALLARMQESGMRARMQAAFDASPEELGQAAADAARRHG
jgi:hypothetical protein